MNKNDFFYGQRNRTQAQADQKTTSFSGKVSVSSWAFSSPIWTNRAFSKGNENAVIYYRSKNIIKAPENAKNVSLVMVNFQKREISIQIPNANGE